MTTRQKKISLSYLSQAIALLLLLALSIGQAPALSAQSDPLPVHPWLIQLAKERPNEKVQVIVQRKASEQIPPQALERAGGQITKDLPIINGFAMELSARAVEALARSKGVRWISIDAPMRAAGVTEGFGEEGFSTPADDFRYVDDMTIQPDGKIVVIGRATNWDSQVFNAIRYNADGTRDTSFGVNGLVMTDISSNYDYAMAVAVQPDGKIVVAGHGYYGNRNGYHFIVVRYNNNGTLDDSFGSSGIVVTPVDRFTNDEVADMLLQPDGKIVVVGRVYTSTSCRIALVRYLSNGQLDGSFGASGAAFAPIHCHSKNYEVLAMAMQTDGKFVVSGGEHNGVDYDMLVTRFTASGALDTSFGNAGYVRTAIGAYHEWGQKVVIQPDGKIIVAGKMTLYSATNSSSDTAVVRYQNDGSLDPTFGVAGKVIADYGDCDVTGLALQSTGKIVVATHFSSGSGYIYLLRFQSNGARDDSFNGTGYAYYYSFRPAGSRAMVVQPDDKIIVGDYKMISSSNGVYRYPAGLARLTADGRLNMGTSPYVRAVGATKLWNERPELLGDGMTVAVVDSGVNSHLELRNENNGSRIKAHQDFTGANNVIDYYGHGTHVAGIIGSNGSTTGGQRIGMAPHVNLLNVKVSNGQGMSLMSDVVAGLQWIFENKNSYNIRVVNLSLNSTVPESYHVNPLSAAIEILWFNGVTVVVAAGNNGTGAGPVDLLPPANDPFVITVGAADSMGTITISDDEVAFFSAYGTTIEGYQKPDIVAPGRNIVSLLAGTYSWIYQNRTVHRLDDYLFRMSGTSMAAPVVSGAVALLLQDEPNLTPDQVKYRLMATANRGWAAYDPAKAGAGYLDIFAAVNGTTTQNANTGLLPSQMLYSGIDPVAWDSVSWNSVSWNSVSWNSVSWNSVSWNSDTWMTNIWDEEVVGAAGMPADALVEETLAPLPDAMMVEETAAEEVNVEQISNQLRLYLPLIAQK